MEGDRVPANTKALEGILQEANSDQSFMRSPLFYARVSFLTAILTMALKAGAFFFTGSVGLFSDAAESGVNLVAAVVAFLALRTAARPSTAHASNVALISGGNVEPRFLTQVLSGTACEETG